MSLFTAIGRIFQRPLYTSDIMSMVAEMREQDPTLDARQQAGRALLWERKASRPVQAEMDAGRLAQKPYPYQNDAH